MPLRRDPILGLTDRRNVPQVDVMKRRGQHVSALLDATPEANRVVVISDRSEKLWKQFESAIVVPDDREVKVEIVNPKDVGNLVVSNTDMVIFDRFDPKQEGLTDKKVVDLLKAPNLADASYRGIWIDYLATNVLGLPALAQRTELRGVKAPTVPGR